MKTKFLSREENSTSSDTRLSIPPLLNEGARFQTRFSSTFQGRFLIPYFLLLFVFSFRKTAFLFGFASAVKPSYGWEPGKACNSEGAGRGIPLSFVVVAAGRALPR